MSSGYATVAKGLSRAAMYKEAMDEARDLLTEAEDEARTALLGEKEERMVALAFADSLSRVAAGWAAVALAAAKDRS